MAAAVDLDISRSNLLPADEVEFERNSKVNFCILGLVPQWKVRKGLISFLMNCPIEVTDCL